MEEINVYPEEYTNTVRFSLSYISKWGINLDKKASFWKKYGHFIVVATIMIFHFVSASMFMFIEIAKSQNLFQNAKFISMWLITIQVFSKAIVISLNKDTIRDVIDELGCNWRMSGLNEEQLKKKNKSLSNLQKIQKVLSLLCWCAGYLYLLPGLFETIYRIIILKQDSAYILPFIPFYPFKITGWYTYFLSYGLQFYCISTNIHMYLGGDILLVVLCANLSSEFVSLQIDFDEIKPAKTKQHEDEITSCDEEYRSIGELVRRHQRLIRTVELLNKSFNKLIFINLLLAAINIVFFAFAARSSSGFYNIANNYMSILVILMTMFVLCYSSEMLCTSSAAIENSAYNNMWYEADTRYQTTIRFIIMRSQKACSLSSLNYFPISLRTFGKVLSTTWSYLSLANTLYEDNSG